MHNFHISDHRIRDIINQSFTNLLNSIHCVHQQNFKVNFIKFLLISLKMQRTLSIWIKL